MNNLITEYKKKYKNFRYSNLLKNRKAQWWFTIAPDQFVDNTFHLMLIHKLDAYILKINTSKHVEAIIPRKAGVHLSGHYDLYFFIGQDNTIYIRYLVSGDGRHQVSDISGCIIEHIDRNAYEQIQNEEDELSWAFVGTEFETLASPTEYQEGQIKYSIHKRRERNQSLVKDAKERFRKNNQGKVFCEICKFNFMDYYGVDYIEVHHLKAVSDMKEGEVTNVEDVCLVCPNCHRIIHSEYPPLGIEVVKGKILEYGNCTKIIKQKKES